MNIPCPSCSKTINRATDQVCPACGFQLDQGAISVPILSQATVVRRKIPIQVQIALNTDRTGSSEAYAQGIPTSQKMILEGVEAKITQVQVWHQTHGDLDCGQDPYFLSQETSVSEAVEDLNHLCFEGGGDPPEHHLDALEHVLSQVPWEVDIRKARGAIISFCNADTKPSRSGISAQVLGEQIRERGLLFYLVAEPYPWCQQIIQSSGGLFLEISNNPNSAELESISSALCASIVGTIGSGKTVPMTLPAT